MELFSNPTRLFGAAFGLFALLTLAVAILPALDNQRNNAPLPAAEPLTASALRGKKLYISNGCVACHTQQVRNVDMDKTWGSRPGIAADYAGVQRESFFINSATLMGTERTGPDLTNVGARQPSPDWHLMHLYNPRAVVAQSIMPAYPWLFKEVARAGDGQVVVNVPAAFREGQRGVVVATPDALDLVAYLQSLKQAPLPENTEAPAFLYQPEQKVAASVDPSAAPQLDGQVLYSTHCQSCHQANGEGLKGAFPPLKGSPVVLDDDPTRMVDVIVNGYDARDDFAVMPAVGKNNRLKPEEVAAIMNHERTSWGNTGRKVSVAEVRKIMEFLAQEAPAQ
jgi:cytochrome c oxidase cbb3-type subunit 2